MDGEGPHKAKPLTTKSEAFARHVTSAQEKLKATQEAFSQNQLTVDAESHAEPIRKKKADTTKAARAALAKSQAVRKAKRVSWAKSAA